MPGLTECTTHFKRVHVITEALEKFKHQAVKPICMHSELRPGSSRVLAGLRNLSCKSVTIRSKMVSAANMVPLSVAPNLEGKEKEELREQYEEQIDLQTIQDMENQDDS